MRTKGNKETENGEKLLAIIVGLLATIMAAACVGAIGGAIYFVYKMVG